MLTVGLVGCGAWGTNILRDLVKLGCRTLVADINPAVREKALDLGAVDFFPSAAELPPCEGFVVAVPIPDLTPVCLGLLHRKQPIFSEKTLCLSLDDHARLKAAGGGRLVFCMHKWHYHPGIEALRQAAVSGEIGELEELVTTRHAWVPDFHGGDVFWTQAVHDLTVVKHILGSIPETVRAIHVIRDASGLPVSLTAMLGDRPTVLLSVSARHCGRTSAASVHGALGSAQLASAYDDHVLLRTRSGERRIPIDTTFPLYLELREFVEHLRGGPEPRCGLEDAREVTQAILRLKNKAGLPT